MRISPAVHGHKGPFVPLRNIWLATAFFVFACLITAVDAGEREVSAAPASPGKTATPRRLVFSSRRWQGEYYSKDIPGGVEIAPSEAAIHTIREDGSELKTIVDLGKRTEYPIPSPDGKWVYFQSNASGRSQIYRAHWDGTDLVNLCEGEKLGPDWKECYGFALSQDGRKLLFTVHNGQVGRIAIAEPDGSQPRFIAPDLGYIYMGALSPKADRLVFSGPARGYRLWQTPLPEQPPQLLTPDHPDSYVPQFTPDGKTIIFFRRDGDVYRVGASGGEVKRLTTGNNYVEFRLSKEDHHGSSDGPKISPDGREIAHLALRDGIANVWTIGIDGENPRQITHRTTGCGRVCWSPDGDRLAFVSFVGKYPQLFVVSARGGEPTQVTNLDSTAVYFVQWGLP